jgi:hypothetical protein
VKNIAEPYRLELEERDPKQIALAIFRFRARRGLGVFYASLSTIPFLVGTLKLLSAPNWTYVAGLILLMVPIWLVSRAAGMRRFYNMNKAIDLYEHGQQSTLKKTSELLKLLRTLFLFIFPFVLFAFLEIYNLDTYAAIEIFVWVVVWAFLNILSYSRESQNRILHRHIEDWIALPITMALLILNTLPIVGSVVNFTFAVPVLLVAGIKSLYEAPEELVRGNE